MKTIAVLMLTRPEQVCLIRLIERELAKREDPLLADLLQMLENAVEPELLSLLRR